jgi:hypothetical protein
MSVEQAFVVRLSGTNPAIRTLVRDLAGARARSRKALPGDRTDVIRFEQLAARLEVLALDALNLGANHAVVEVADRPGLAIWDQSAWDGAADFVPGPVSSWLAYGDIAIEVRLPLVQGVTHHTHLASPVEAPASPWRSPDGVTGRRAVLARFRHQLRCALNGEAGAAIMPSGVSNSVLTEVLREFVAGPGLRVDVPVSYRDGSRARPFPLRCLPLHGRGSDQEERVLRFTLLSIRHLAMDVDVDGAWLRNTDISRPRPAGETDALAYELSRQQLHRLATGRPLRMYLYQTGMEPVVVGFYRALTEHLLERPGTVSVIPMYFRQPAAGDASVRETVFAEGTAWMV